MTQGLTRSKGLKVLGRSKSEGKRRAGVATEEERMDELVRRAERSCGASGVGTEAQSGMGSYFWSDALGVCWDGREQGELVYDVVSASS